MLLYQLLQSFLHFCVIFIVNSHFVSLSGIVSLESTLWLVIFHLFGREEYGNIFQEISIFANIIQDIGN